MSKNVIVILIPSSQTYKSYLTWSGNMEKYAHGWCTWERAPRKAIGLYFKQRLSCVFIRSQESLMFSHTVANSFVKKLKLKWNCSKGPLYYGLIEQDNIIFPTILCTLYLFTVPCHKGFFVINGTIEIRYKPVSKGHSSMKSWQN
jgi:hypothetical protein